MAKSSKKTVWVVLAVLLLVMTQLSVIGFVLAKTFSPVIAQQTPSRGQLKSYPPPVARPVEGSLRKGMPASKTARKPKPSGPRAEAPTISKESGVYTNAFAVELKAKSSKATIRYTLDGTEPSQNSPIYSSPIQIAQTTLLRATCFEEELAPSAAATRTYTMLDDDLLRFSSNLPIIVIDSFNQPITYVDYSEASIRFIDAKDGRATLLRPADLDARCDLKRRGYTSLRYPKMSLTLKTRDDDWDKLKAPIFGLPSESDWVLYAPYVDKSLIRDALGYDLSNQMGRYAPRTRFVEVFLHRYGGKLGYRDYQGVYVFVEKIKRDKERVNVAKLGTNDNSEPNITGGYILKRDHGAMTGGGGGRGRRGPGGFGDGPPRSSNDGVGFITPRGLHLFHVEPEEQELTDTQRRWIAKYFGDFERALHGPNFTSPTEGYARYLDVDAFIDHFWLVELTKNVDGFRYSAYLHKPRNGKITLGPAWDWNLSFGNADYYDGYETSGWYYENLRDSEISWIYRLRQDPDFMQRSADRWAELRRGPLATDKVLGRVDAMRTELMEGQERNFRKWGIMGRPIKPNYYVGATFDQEINWLKVWTKDRLTWIDRQFPATPKLSQKPGAVSAGTKIALSGGSGEIYYTLDGSDPRASGGSRSRSAKRYEGPIAVERETKIVARMLRSGSWSAPIEGTYTAGRARASAE
jgi:hypothetical protein